jgi:hypothetical protein
MSALAVEALEFYRNGFQLHPKRSKTGVDLSKWKPTEALLEDCGNRADTALRSLKAQGEAEPVAWRTPMGVRSGEITGKQWQVTQERVTADWWREQGSHVEPLFLSPSPASGWNEAVEACVRFLKAEEEKYAKERVETSEPNDGKFSMYLAVEAALFRIAGALRSLTRQEEPTAGEDGKAIFAEPADGDSSLEAAAREAGWALTELVDSIAWEKRGQVSRIITRLGVALSAPAEPRAGGKIPVGMECCGKPYQDGDPEKWSYECCEKYVSAAPAASALLAASEPQGDGWREKALSVMSKARHSGACDDGYTLVGRLNAEAALTALEVEGLIPRPVGLAADVVRLVIAAREVMDEDASPESRRNLDKAAEAFADRVPWEDAPTPPAPQVDGPAKIEEAQEARAVAAYGREAVDAAKLASEALARTGSPDFQALWTRISRSTDPFGEMVRWHQKQQSLQAAPQETK